MSFMITLAVLSLFLMRPSHLGEAYNFAGSLIFLAAAFFTFLLQKQRPDNFRHALLVPMMMCLFWMYSVFLAGMIDVVELFLYYGALLAFIVDSGAVMLFASRQRLHKFTQIFVTIVGFLGLSSLVTLGLNLFVPPEQLVFGRLSIPTYNSGDLLLPFSLGYNKIMQPWGLTYRLSAFWREVGIAQAIFAWAMGVLLFSSDFPRRKILLIGAVGGAFATQLTLALMNVALVFSLFAFVSNKRSFGVKFVFGLLSLPIATLLFLYALNDESTGLLAKMGTVSYSDRIYAIENAFLALSENPWGYGLYSNNGVVRANSGINLLSSVAATGILGMLIYLSIWITAIFSDENAIKKSICLAPIFLTMLTSQPLIDGFGIYVILILPVVVQTHNTQEA